MSKKLIIVFLVFAVIGVGLFFLLTMGNVGTEYNTAEVTVGQVSKYVQDTGTISSKNIRRYYGNGVSKVDEMTLEIGDAVKKGDLLLKYEDNLDLEIKKVEKQIEAMEAAYNDVLLGMDKESVSSARVEVTRVNNLLKQAIVDRDRTEALYNSGAVSLMELEAAKNNVTQLRSTLSIAQNTYNKLAKDVSSNVIDKYEAEIEVLALTLESLESTRDDYSVYADVDGIVTAINTFKGDIPSPAMMIIEIMDPTEKVVSVDFMVEDAILVKSGYEAKISDLTLDIQMDGLTVDRVYPKAFVTLSELAVEENRQTVEIGLPAGTDLAYGVEVETMVMIDAPRQALMVPVGAVIEKDGKYVVNVLSGNDPVETVIEVGIKVNGTYEVKSGVSEGDLVILNYQED